jgi:hypothetical protein
MLGMASVFAAFDPGTRKMGIGKFARQFHCSVNQVSRILAPPAQ